MPLNEKGQYLLDKFKKDYGKPRKKVSISSVDDFKKRETEKMDKLMTMDETIETDDMKAVDNEDEVDDHGDLESVLCEAEEALGKLREAMNLKKQ